MLSALRAVFSPAAPVSAQKPPQKTPDELLSEAEGAIGQRKLDLTLHVNRMRKKHRSEYKLAEEAIGRDGDTDACRHHNYLAAVARQAMLEAQREVRDIDSLAAIIPAQRIKIGKLSVVNAMNLAMQTVLQANDGQRADKQVAELQDLMARTEVVNEHLSQSLDPMGTLADDAQREADRMTQDMMHKFHVRAEGLPPVPGMPQHLAQDADVAASLS